MIHASLQAAVAHVRRVVAADGLLLGQAFKNSDFCRLRVAWDRAYQVAVLGREQDAEGTPLRCRNSAMDTG